VRTSPQMTLPALGWRMNKTYHLAFVLVVFAGLNVPGPATKPKLDVDIPTCPKVDTSIVFNHLA
jgi:hypothetical protein